MPQAPVISRGMQAVRGFLVCASFFNLALLPMWMNHQNDYLEPLPYAGLLLMVLITGAVLFAAASALKKYWSYRILQGAALILFLVFPLDGIRKGLGVSAHGLANMAGLGDAASVRILLVVVLLALAALCFKHMQRAVSLAVGLLLLMSPLLGFSAYLAVTRIGPESHRYVHYDNGSIGTASPQIVKKSKQQVYLLVLDEADYSLIYENRPAGLELPALDTLSQSSLFFTQAYSPGHDTVLSVPALVMGKGLRTVRGNGQSLAVRTTSGDYFPDWRITDNLLNSVTSAGMRVAVIGYYHPYCGDMSLELAYCSHWRVFPYRRWAFSLMPYPLAALQDNFLLKHALKPYLAKAARQFAKDHQETFDEMAAELNHLPDGYDLVYGHLGFPHPTPVPVAAIATYGRVTRADYFGNLQRADVQVGRLLARLGQSADKNGVVIVTSDHGLRLRSWASMGYDISDFAFVTHAARNADLHVPFIVHFMNSNKRVAVDTPASTLHTKALVEALLAGRIKDVDAAAAFMRQMPFELPPGATATTFEH